MLVLQNLAFRTRLSLSLGMAIATCIVLPTDLHLITRLLATWTAGVCCYLVLTLLMMKNANAEQTRDRAQQLTLHNLIFLGLMGTAVTVGLSAFRLMRSTAKDAPVQVLTLHVAVSVLAILSTWFLLHTLFAQQYAALYYRRDSIHSEEPARGLQFVEQETPTYWDFLYFSFILGATAQTSDTFITSRTMRRLALGQCLTAFWFFVGIIAMSVNIVSELLNAG